MTLGTKRLGVRDIVDPGAFDTAVYQDVIIEKHFESMLRRYQAANGDLAEFQFTVRRPEDSPYPVIELRMQGLTK